MGLSLLFKSIWKHWKNRTSAELRMGSFLLKQDSDKDKIPPDSVCCDCCCCCKELTIVNISSFRFVLILAGVDPGEGTKKKNNNNVMKM